MALKQSLLICLLLLHSNLASAAEEKNCLNQYEVAVAGLLPGMKENALKTSSLYRAKETIDGVDDGGSYKAQKYLYANFEIVIVRGVIDSILISSPTLIWSNDIKLGMKRQKIEKVINYALVAHSPSSSQYLVCATASDIYAVLLYQDNVLKSIEILLDRP